jgi:hypothetical protein
MILRNEGTRRQDGLCLVSIESRRVCDQDEMDIEEIPSSGL